MVDSIDFTGPTTLWFSYWAPGIGQAKLAFVISVLYLRPLSFENVPTFTNRDLTVLSHQNWKQMPLPWPGSSEPCQFPLKSLESNWSQSHANTAITYNVWIKLAIYCDASALAKKPRILAVRPWVAARTLYTPMGALRVAKRVGREFYLLCYG